MVNFHQLRTWQADGIEVHDVVRRLLRGDGSSDDIVKAWGLAFDLTGDLPSVPDQPLDEISEVLTLAAASVPPGARSDAGITRVDVEEYVDHAEWELALEVL